MVKSYARGMLSEYLVYAITVPSYRAYIFFVTPSILCCT